MCGRYYVDDAMLSELKRIISNLDKKLKVMSLNGDIKPSMAAPIIFGSNGQKEISVFNWGYKRFDGKGLIINARSETAMDRPMFKESFENRRCIVPARGFYEWDSYKNKFKFTYKNNSVMYIAGIFKFEQDNLRFVILTTKANLSMEKVHERMPLILQGNMFDEWLFDRRGACNIINAVPPELARDGEAEQLRLEF